MKQNIKEVLRSEIQVISPSKSEISEVYKDIQAITALLNKNIKKAKISAEIFLGGSAAKGTLIKKNKYDIDVFIRFNKNKYKDNEISGLLKRIVPKNARRIHGSRDYFSVKHEKENLEIEIIPVIKINRPEEAENITDLSYFHVNYVSKKIKRDHKLIDEIRLAKAFAHYQDCYGAESYINGFSGYAVELLIIYYKNFLNFIKNVSKMNLSKGEMIIDSENKFKNSMEVKRELNESKLQSPIILIDPTYRYRNALAALSYETFVKFQIACRAFLENPSNQFFIHKDKEKILDKRYGKNLIKLELATFKQPGDIAGTKLKKFYKYFITEVQRYFDIKDSEFDYNEDKNKGKVFLAASPKKEIIFPGPPIKMRKPLAAFRKQHVRVIIKKRKAYAYEKNNPDFSSFLKKFINDKRKIIEEMDVDEMKII